MANEVEELEELDLEDLADADETVASAEEGADEDAKPKSKSKKAKAKAEKVGVGSAELAAALGTDEKPVSGRELRVMLRDKGANKTKRFQENKRYHWDTVDQALEELGFDSIEEAREALKESRAKRLEALKEKAEKSRKEKESKEDED